MTIILWLRRSSKVDIGEQRIYSDAFSILDEGDIISIGYGDISNIERDKWERNQVIKMEIIP